MGNYTAIKLIGNCNFNFMCTVIYVLYYGVGTYFEISVLGKQKNVTTPSNYISESKRNV